MPRDCRGKFYSISPIPFASFKEKDCPSNLDSLDDFAIVREMVDFPVAAIPFNQNMHGNCGEKAHSLINEEYQFSCRENTHLHVDPHMRLFRTKRFERILKACLIPETVK
jgi:hypothetical protein